MATTKSANKQKTLVLAVKIDKSLGLGKKVIDAAAGDWIINKEKSKHVTTLVAVSKQTVKEVFAVSDPGVVSGNRIRFNVIQSIPQKQWSPYLSLAPFKYRGAVKYL